MALVELNHMCSNVMMVAWVEFYRWQPGIGVNVECSLRHYQYNIIKYGIKINLVTVLIHNVHYYSNLLGYNLYTKLRGVRKSSITKLRI